MSSRRTDNWLLLVLEVCNCQVETYQKLIQRLDEKASSSTNLPQSLKYLTSMKWSKNFWILKQSSRGEALCKNNTVWWKNIQYLITADTEPDPSLGSELRTWNLEGWWNGRCRNWTWAMQDRLKDQGEEYIEMYLVEEERVLRLFLSLLFYLLSLRRHLLRRKNIQMFFDRLMLKFLDQRLVTHQSEKKPGRSSRRRQISG